jgi:DNA invertase Pin-like site-specific DNA recombinase
MSKPKYFLYARKSSEDDDKQMMSIEAQLFELREFAHKENLAIVREWQESQIKGDRYLSSVSPFL